MWKFLLFSIISLALIDSLESSAVMKCEFTSDGSCMFYNMTAITQQNELITVEGQSSNYINTVTDNIEISGISATYVPNYLFTIFPNLERFTINNIGLKNFGTNSFGNCVNLKDLNIGHENIPNIPDGFALSCTSIKKILLDNNNIETIDSNAFRGLANLEYVSIYNNKITCIPSKLFQYTPIIQSISFSTNSIRALDENTFNGLSNLKQLQLEYNSISFIPAMKFSANFSNGFLFNLYDNPIYAIHPTLLSSIFEPSVIQQPRTQIQVGFLGSQCIDPASSCYHLYSSNFVSCDSYLQPCYQNYTSSMSGTVSCSPESTTTTTTTTTTLSPVTTASPTVSPLRCFSDKFCRYFLDQYNRYTCVIDGVDSVLTSIGGNHIITFTDLDVKRVVFTNSFLYRVPQILFQKFSNLEYLSVSNSSITVINGNTLSLCGQLRIFDASFNDISSISGTSFATCPCLEVVDLSGNHVDAIPAQLFSTAPSLKMIYLNRPFGMGSF